MPSSAVLGSAHAAAAQGAPPLRQPCNIAPVAPRLAVLARSIILVSKNSAPTNDCVFVDLGTTLPFTGEGVFECSEPDKLIVTNAQGVRYPLPLTIPGTVLSAGLRVRIGACAPSARTGGDRPASVIAWW